MRSQIWLDIFICNLTGYSNVASDWLPKVTLSLARREAPLCLAFVVFSPVENSVKCRLLFLRFFQLSQNVFRGFFVPVQTSSRLFARLSPFLPGFYSWFISPHATGECFLKCNNCRKVFRKLWFIFTVVSLGYESIIQFYTGNEKH